MLDGVEDQPAEQKMPEDDDRRESQRVRWHRSPAPTTTWDRLRRQLGEPASMRGEDNTANQSSDGDEKTNAANTAVHPASGGADETSQDPEFIEDTNDIAGPERRVGAAESAVTTNYRAWGAQPVGRGPRWRVAGGHWR